MNHGDIGAEVILSAEPLRVFMLWRSTLRSGRPEQANVVINKRRRPSFWSSFSPSFDLNAVQRTERKLADISLSAISLQLDSGEIENASRLHEILWKWLGRGEDPVLDREMPFTTVNLKISGEAETLIGDLEKMHDLEPLSSFQFVIAFRQDRPPVVKTRMPMTIMKSGDLALALPDFEGYKHMLADGQADRFLALGNRVENLFRKRRDARLKVLNALAKEVLGSRAGEFLTSPNRRGNRPIHCLERYEFDENIAWLKSKRESAEAVHGRPGVGHGVRREGRSR